MMPIITQACCVDIALGVKTGVIVSAPTTGGTMQIDWSKAPEWARWVAMDDDHTWWWFENKPEYDGVEWFADGGYEKAFDAPPLQERPQ